MPKPEQIQIRRHMSLGELNRNIRILERYAKVLKRLYFVKYRYQGMGVEAAASRVGITKSVGYTWQNRWNEGGYDGLVPKHAGGRPSKLSNAQREDLKGILSSKIGWTTAEVKDIILHEFGVEYTPKQVRIILKNDGCTILRSTNHHHQVNSEHNAGSLEVIS